MSYLLDRGFAATDIPTLCHHYGLKGCLTGTFRHRVIIPFFFRGDLVGWTARAIAAAENRYLSFPNSEAVKRILYNFDEASLGGDALVVVEGPIDALKIDFYAKQQRVRAIGLLGLSFTEAQISLLVEVAKRFTHTYILLDPGAEVQAMRLKAQLALISPKILDVGKGIEDPGAMTQEQVQLLAKKIHEILLPRG
jgi:hypothetical protein